VKAREKSLFKDFSKSWNFLLLWPRKQLSYWELNFFFFYTILAILLLHFGATAAPSLSYLEMNIFAIEEVTPLLVLWQGPGCRSVVSICLLKNSLSYLRHKDPRKLLLNIPGISWEPTGMKLSETFPHTEVHKSCIMRR
jgi:hypothetical protein